MTTTAYFKPALTHTHSYKVISDNKPSHSSYAYTHRHRHRHSHTHTHTHTLTHTLTQTHTHAFCQLPICISVGFLVACQDLRLKKTSAMGHGGAARGLGWHRVPSGDERRRPHIPTPPRPPPPWSQAD